MSNLYQEFKRRQQLAEQSFLSAEKALKEDWSYLQRPEGKARIFEELRSFIVPEGSYADRILTFFDPPKRIARFKGRAHSSLSAEQWTSSPKWVRPILSKWRKYQPIVDVVYQVTKPVLISTGVSLARNVFGGIVRRLIPFAGKYRRK